MDVIFGDADMIRDLIEGAMITVQVLINVPMSIGRHSHPGTGQYHTAISANAGRGFGWKSDRI